MEDLIPPTAFIVGSAVFIIVVPVSVFLIEYFRERRRQRRYERHVTLYHDRD